jgi:hypothetical protein
VQYAVPLETPAQGGRFNRRLVNACLRAQTQEGPVREGQLHVAIVGAGATGTELAAELHRTTRELVAYGLDRIDPQRDIRIILIEAAERILPDLPERISEATAAERRSDRLRMSPSLGNPYMWSGATDGLIVLAPSCCVLPASRSQRAVGSDARLIQGAAECDTGAPASSAAIRPSAVQSSFA